MLHHVTPHEIDPAGFGINQVAGVSRSVSVSTANKIIRAIAFHTSLPSSAPHALGRHHGRIVEGIQS
ncbi:hypothetical protein HEQ63_10165 [Haematospirillum jordaniae]|uniref:hypothetical protein n=1 Tax=Haematospirillum jordaniae TaxID=1549855 RepID=UPI001432A892|nr:hypothetical protein [Haematospirillum jordaniae]NKD86545.1 hypothetical protein [Haematospirillum jordaniae]